MAAPPIEEFLARATVWASGRPDVRALLLVGSHARNDARPDSDVDLLILAERPERLRDDSVWVAHFGQAARQMTEAWGRVTSRRVWYDDGREVEFGVTDVGWADPADDSTLSVLRAGARVLWDPDGLFRFLSTPTSVKGTSAAIDRFR